MNPRDVLRYGHLTVLATLKDFNFAHAARPGVYGVWSVKEIVAHLASFELMLEDVLKSMSGDHVTPTLDAYRRGSGKFNDMQVAWRRGKDYANVFAEYRVAHGHVFPGSTPFPGTVRSTLWTTLLSIRIMPTSASTVHRSNYSGSVPREAPPDQR